MREKIRTFSGIHMSPADPRPEEICIEDIAHALSLMTRANGHFPVFYSVAQHSLDCAAMAQAEGRSSREVLACLLHDASEAYLSDITRPVKGCLPEYRRIEQVLQEMIYEKYLIAPPTEREREIVKRMDDTCLYYEFEHFTGEKLFDVAPQAAVLPEYRECPMREVEKKFLALFEKLMAQTVQEDGVRISSCLRSVCAGKKCPAGRWCVLPARSGCGSCGSHRSGVHRGIFPEEKTEP